MSWQARQLPERCVVRRAVFSARNSGFPSLTFWSVDAAAAYDFDRLPRQRGLEFRWHSPTWCACPCPDSPICVGDQALPLARRSVVGLGVPVGTPDFVEAHLQARQRDLLDSLPALHDSHVAWLSLSCCALPRAQYDAICPPNISEPSRWKARTVTQQATMVQTSAAWQGCCLPMKRRNCNCRLKRAPLALRHDGSRSTTRHAPAAYWATWADALRAVARRDPDFAHEVATSL